jgi:hypothetical protein
MSLTGVAMESVKPNPGQFKLTYPDRLHLFAPRIGASGALLAAHINPCDDRGCYLPACFSSPRAFIHAINWSNHRSLVVPFF